MQKITRHEHDNKIRLLLLFYTPAELSRITNLNRLTILRWTEPGHTAKLSQRKILDDAIDELHKKLGKNGAIGRCLSNALDEFDFKEATASTAYREPADHCMTQLRKFLLGRYAKKSDVIAHMCDTLGFTPSQVTFASQKLKVFKKPVGAGRGSHSVWSLT